MGKKTKQGKQRKDVFYRRAKEAGYRARASYKLIQLNKKYNFLQSSRVCIDLCAAPGSWMQVASKFMPVSSVIIGVDRYPIAPIPNAICIQGDITTEKVRKDLKANLKTWKADLVLHDGAPNVGQNWLYDAYQQNLLVLHAFKLACEFLQKGGTFISKVFRSKDHLSLQYVFRKLFKRVEATKPIASRFESAEIFVVCQGFLAPDKADAEYFDPKYVFQTLENEPKNTINVLKPEKTKRKAEGYEEGATMLFKKKKISEFIMSSKYIEILEEANEFEWDLSTARESKHTNNDIIEFCKDIKVLNRKDLRALINWRKAVKLEIENIEKESKTIDLVKEETTEEVDEELVELEKLQEEVLKLKDSQKREEKQHRKKVEKKKKKLEEKLKLRLTIPGDPGPQETDMGALFSLENLNRAENLDSIIDQSAEILADRHESDEEFVNEDRKKWKMQHYSRDASYIERTGTDGGPGEEDEEEDESSSEDEGLNIDKEDDKKKKRVSFANDVTFGDDYVDNDTNPLLTDLVGDNVLDRRERKAEKWFNKNVFDDVEDDEIEDYELGAAIERHEEAGGKIVKKASPKNVKDRKTDDDFKVKDGPESDSDSDMDTDDEDDDKSDSGVDSDNGDAEKENKGADPSEPIKKKGKKRLNLSNVGKALATQMIRSKKAKRDLYDQGWNKYMWGDEDLPEWFADDERKHNAPVIQVNKEDVEMYENQDKAVDSRTIKKVVEAKARKQRRIKKRMTRARKKAEVIADDSDMTAREKAVEMNKIYKKAAAVSKPKNKTYIVMKKCFGGKKPKGGKGPTQMVDRRLKKDKRASAKSQQTKQGQNRAKNGRKIKR